jgi:hypothetical protein
MHLSFGSVVFVVLALLLGELEDWGGLSPADDLAYSLLDEVADLCPAGDPTLARGGIVLNSSSHGEEASR